VRGRSDGVAQVVADQGAGTVRAVFDPSKTSAASIRDAITQAGYDVTS